MTPTELNVLRAQLIAMLCSGTKWPEMTEPQRSDLTMTAYGMSYGITNVCELFEPAIRTADAPAPAEPAKPELDSSVIKRYVKQPVVIEAAEFTEQNTDAIVEWVGSDSYAALSNHGRPILVITTLEGDHEASLGDFIIKGVKGEFYPCKPDIFAMTYSDGQEPTKPEPNTKTLGGVIPDIGKDVVPNYRKLLRELVYIVQRHHPNTPHWSDEEKRRYSAAVAAVRP